MEIRIGGTLGGRAVGFDTRSTCPLLLVGDAGQGKTTVARHLTRWWLADTARHAHVYARCISEWADLCAQVEHAQSLDRADQHGCQPGSCLVVVDDIEVEYANRIVRVSRRTPPIVMTALSGSGLAGRTPLGTRARCLGLVRPARPQPMDALVAAVLNGQGRLDWPAGTVAVVLDERGPLDFPCHRWDAPTESRPVLATPAQLCRMAR